MHKYLLFLLLLIAGCDEDNSTEPTGNRDSALHGTWNLSTLKVNGNVTNPSNLSEVPVTIQFNADGTGNVWLSDYGSPAGKISFTWQTSGSQINLTTVEETSVVNYTVSGNSATISFVEGSDTIEIMYSKQGPSTYDPALFGTWSLTTMKVNGTVVNPQDLDEVPVQLQFNSDGSGTVWLEDKGNPTGSDTFNWNTSQTQITFLGIFTGTYSVVGNTLTITYMENSDNIELTLSKQ
jgi:hypothetical protein